MQADYQSTESVHTVTLLQSIENTTMTDPRLSPKNDIHLPSEEMTTDVIPYVTKDLESDGNNVTVSMTAAPDRGFEMNLSNKFRSISPDPDVGPDLNFNF